MAHIEVEFTNKTICVRSQAFSCEFSETDKNKKAVLVFLRSLCSPETGKPLFTYQQLADAFGYRARQNVENFLAELRASQQSFWQFLSRVSTKHDRLFPLVEAQILSSVLLSLTTNASERFNRKIEKCFSGRYGIPSEESAKVLLRGLWLKEVLLRGQHHVETTSEVRSLNLSRICQESLYTGKILHFFHDYEASQVEKLA